MSKALNETGRPIIYACSWPAYQGGLPPQVNYTLLGEICNLWRNYGDIQDSWDDIVDIATWWGDHSGNSTNIVTYVEKFIFFQFFRAIFQMKIKNELEK